MALARAVQAQDVTSAAVDAHEAIMRALQTTLAENRAARARAVSVRNRTRR
jgi:hypothetical protein